MTCIGQPPNFQTNFIKTNEKCKLVSEIYFMYLLKAISFSVLSFGSCCTILVVHNARPQRFNVHLHHPKLAFKFFNF